ncbi:MAG: hypothetical protein IH591_06655 [Bacteroidales bacterium]|nr:hypothetical protein [Bacteroidales bacterium]
MIALKQKMESRLQRIANVLLLNASFTGNLGLLNGKMGIVIFFYLYSQYTKNELYEKVAGELIDEIYIELNTNLPVDFSGGLMGIGWGIEYLIRGRFLEGDSDEVLKEIDNAVYRAALRTPLLINNDNELFGFGLYYLARLEGRKTDENNLNTIIKKQMLVYLHDDCERLLILDKTFDSEAPFLTINQLNSILFFIIGVQQLQLFPVKLSKIEHYILEYVKRYGISSQSSTELKTFRLMLLKCRENTTALPFKNEYKEIADAIRPEEVTSDDELLTRDFIKTAWYALLYNIPEIRGSDNLLLEEKVIEIIDNEENWEKRLSVMSIDNLGLDGGMAGLGLAILNGLLKSRRKEW